MQCWFIHNFKTLASGRGTSVNGLLLLLRVTIVLLYLDIIIIPLLEVLLLSSNIITTEYA